MCSPKMTSVSQPTLPMGSKMVYLYDQVVAPFAEALQHAQKQVSGLHKVLEKGAWLLGLVKLSQEGEEYLPVFHQVEDVTWIEKG